MSSELPPSVRAASPPPEAVCRICQSPDDEGPGSLVSPCSCDGSVRWVHAACLGTWRLKGPARNAAQCELCGTLYRYELTAASAGEVLFASLLGVGDYTLALLVQFGLGLAVSAAGGGAVVWAMWVEPSGCLLALLAVADVLRPLIGGHAVAACGLPLSRHPQQGGGGVLPRAVRSAASLARLTGEGAMAEAEQFAQDEAVARALAVVARGRQSQEFAASALALEAAAPGGAGAPALPGGGSADPLVAGGGRAPPERRLEAAGLVLAQVVFFFGTHVCLGAYWWCVKTGLGPGRWSASVEAACFAGTAYWLAAVAALGVGAALRAPLRAVRGGDGLPVVRSLTCKERPSPRAGPPPAA